MGKDIDKRALLTEKQRDFLDHLAGEAKGDIRKAMDLAGYSKATGTGEVIKSLRNEIREVAETLLAAHAVKAVVSLVDVMDSPNQMGAGNKVQASNSVLDRVGMGKKEDKPEVITIQPIFFLPEKESIEPKTINGQHKVIDGDE